jgi:hypothetical protein
MHDDILRAALETRRWLVAHDEVAAAFSTLSRSRLADLIDRYIQAYPTGPLVPQLHEVAMLNAGTLADLDVSDFQDFVRERTGLSTSELSSFRCLLAWFDEHGNDVAQDLGLRAAISLETNLDEH